MKTILAFLAFIVSVNLYAAETYTPPPSQLADGDGARLPKRSAPWRVWILQSLT